MKKKLVVPKFKNEQEEWEFWEALDLSEYFEPSDFRHVSFPNLKPTSVKIGMRIPQSLLARVKTKANALGMPYQALIKEAIAEKLARSG
jgi:predicted DNA binding CopG/RHH family protein